jgi:hypothetical protein
MALGSVKPMFQAWTLAFPSCHEILELFEKNRQYWDLTTEYAEHKGVYPAAEGKSNSSNAIIQELTNTEFLERHRAVSIMNSGL